MVFVRVLVWGWKIGLKITYGVMWVIDLLRFFLWDPCLVGGHLNVWFKRLYHFAENKLLTIVYMNSLG